jgi:predicted nucleotidyltransferase
MAKVHPHLDVDSAQLAALCRRWGITDVALFGSYARGDFRPDSDVDLMVVFAPGRKPSLWGFVALRDEFCSVFARPVDVVISGTIRNPFRLKSIERDITPLYAA